ncbi:MAG: TIGR02556 family CRISPR-associated protein [Candidatus Methanofastidiosia archaeon]
MLKAVRDYGQFLVKEKNLNEIDVLVESYKLRSINNVICIDFKCRNEKIEFEMIHIEKCDSSSAQKYLYRTFRGGHYDVTPTSVVRLDENTADKIMKRLNLWFKTFQEKYNHPLISALGIEIRKKKAEISRNISDLCSSLDRKENRGILFTVSISTNGNREYLSDITIFRKVFIEESCEYFYHRGYGRDVYSKGEGRCSLCFASTSVFGFASPFSIFTVDKKGFAYDFSQENSWRQLPICRDCAIYLAIGRQFLEENLTYSLYEYRYYVIPRFVLGEIGKDFVEEIRFRKGIDYHEGLVKDCRNPLLEDDILDILKEKEDAISLIFVFFKPKQKDFFDVMKYVEDVPPSWIKKTSNTFCQINLKYLFKERFLKVILGKEWSENFLTGKWKGKRVPRTNMCGVLKDFFPENYVNVIGDILGARPIEENYLIRAFIREIRKKHVNNSNWSERLFSLKSLYLLTFLIGVDLIASGEKRKRKQNEEVWPMETEMEEKKLERIENFFKDFSEAFNTPDKKAVFLEGVLTTWLLNIQLAKRGTTPFRSKLSGLKLNQRKVKSLLPEIMEKSVSYEVSYHWLEELVSRFFVEADERGWVISDDEISYYFALGLNLARVLKGGDKYESNCEE